MPSVEELLSVAEADVNTRSAIDSRIEIDADTRIIQMMPQDKLFGVESDEKSERKYFKVPKIVGNGVDLSKLQLRINYQNASKIPSGNITNEWNTTLAEGKVLEGLEVETSQEQQYQASDYLEQLKQQLLEYSKEIKDTFPSDYTAMSEDVKNLKDNKVDKTEFRSTLQTVFAYIADIRAYIGLDNENLVGIQVDYKNKTFRRLAEAVNLSKGSDFDKFTMFGGRKRCNVADDGSIVAWYGDADYKEDGSMGQVMVYQPKFYYLVCPAEYDPIDTGIGYHLRKANYYVSETQRAGFKLHPAFYDKNGNEVDYILMSAYEGCIYDTSANAYLKNDEQVMDASKDKFSSIAGARPASGVSQNLTRSNIEQMAKNRGEGWHSLGIKTASMEQLLMIVEMGMMNLQTAIGQGVVNLPWTTGSDTTSSYASATGSTASLGNGTGRATKTTTYEDGKATEYTVDGKTSICYRGVENFWGNIWKFAYGINFYCEVGKPFLGYVCKDFNYAESKKTDNYENIGFALPSENGYVSAMGYSTKYDWLFLPSEVKGNSSLPVGDYYYQNNTWDGYRIVLLGGIWADGSDAGGFYWGLTDGVRGRGRAVGGRLVYIPTKDSSVYNATINSWKEQMAV